ncbi:MAG: autotransporter assembly complex family protein [Paracoccaceae bacterium]
MAAVIVVLGLVPAPLTALDRLDFTVAGGDETLTKTLRAASLLLTQQADGSTSAQDLFAAARADYARILGALYAEGHYSAVISIRIDGREAASIAPLNAPARIGTVQVTVDPGPAFRFSRAAIAPLAPETRLPEGFRAGQPAQGAVITEAVDAAVLSWREAGHAKVATASDDIVADHARATLAAEIRLDPGPRLRFGPVTVSGAERMRVKRIAKIAGLREGEAFSQSELDRAAARLRRTGIFRSVTLTEAEFPVAGDLLPIGIAVAEAKPRRYSIGAEIASLDGLSLSGYWLHRNLMGGGERLKIDGAITNIGSGESGIDYSLGVTLDRPATLSPDTTASLSLTFGHLDEIDYAADVAEIGLSFRHYFSEELSARVGLSYEYAQGRDPGGDFRFRSLSLPMGVTWDRRDNAVDARKGFYLDATLKPFTGFGDTGSGARLTFDARAYRSFGQDDRVTLAGRLQGGAILGSDLLETPRDDLFFSGGGGTVRGHPYKSLGIAVRRAVGDEFLIGGAYMLAASAEVRTRVTEKIGVVGFVDAGRIGVDGFFDDLGGWQAGAGLGLRYETGFGPIRLDVAAPVHGDTGDGVQIYIGLGQSF